MKSNQTSSNVPSAIILLCTEHRSVAYGADKYSHNFQIVTLLERSADKRFIGSKPEHSTRHATVNCATAELLEASPLLPNSGVLFPMIPLLRAYTEGRAMQSPHFFSISGDTFAEGPLGQKILDLSLFIGAISRSFDQSSLALEY